MNRNLALIWAFTLVVLVLQAALAYHSLPETIASSFDFDGRPRRYGDKDSFYIAWYLGIVLLNSLVLLMKPLFRWMPASTINLPNHDYWFATPERKMQAAGRMTDFMAAVFSCVNIMMLLVFQYIANFNLYGRSGFPLWVAFLIIPVLIILPIPVLYRLFRVPKS